MFISQEENVLDEKTPYYIFR